MSTLLPPNQQFAKKKTLRSMFSAHTIFKGQKSHIQPDTHNNLIGVWHYEIHIFLTNGIKNTHNSSSQLQFQLTTTLHYIMRTNGLLNVPQTCQLNDDIKMKFSDQKRIFLHNYSC